MKTFRCGYRLMGYYGSVDISAPTAYDAKMKFRTVMPGAILMNVTDNSIPVTRIAGRRTR